MELFDLFGFKVTGLWSKSNTRMNKVWDDLMNGHKYNQNSSPELHRVRMTKTHDSTVMWYAEMVTKTVRSLAACFQH